ncbi:MAG: alpha/beta fold hydrolase [Brevundimonas sp.]|uniref:alpha/beta fold hydrolase n=1 Tax=Brevundimonas sp. TaxID=1871086 RepID=UPI003918CB21
MLQRLILILVLAVITAAPAVAHAVQTSPPASLQAFQSDRIVVESRGSGPDVIMIPGLASTADVWRRTAEALPGRRVHLVTVRGFGDAPPAANAQGVVIAPVAAEIRRFIAEQRLSRPALIGHSMGGQVALRVAADARDGVGRVMVVDASPFFPSLISPGATVGDVDPIARIAYQAVMFLGDDALRLQGQRMGADLGGAAEAVFGTLGWQGGDRRVLAQTLYEVMTTDLRSRLPDITVPVTVVYGWSADDRNPRARIDDLFRSGYRSLRAPARFERIEGAEHMVMIDQPRRFMAAVERFLTDG